MEEKETHYFVFKFINGDEQEFQKEDDKLSSLIRNTDKERIMIDNVIINLNNVISVTVETKTGREKEEKELQKQQAETAEALGNMMR